MSAPPCPNPGDFTVEDYLRTPDGPPWYELIEGQLVLEPTPTSGHQGILRDLSMALFAYLKSAQIGTLLFAPLDVYLNESNVFQPDIRVVMNARRKIITQRGIRGAPDFVVEILSPSNRALDRGPKFRVYAQSGVRELWIVDPRERTIESFVLR